jgi:hypothetical protein
VRSALQVDDIDAYRAWYAAHHNATIERAGVTPWQQFVIHAVDERNDGIPDFYLELGTIAAGKFYELPIDIDVHAFGDDSSYRCFHVDPSKLDSAQQQKLALCVIAKSGSELVKYRGYSSSAASIEAADATGGEDADRSPVIQFDPVVEKNMTFFFPFTTTLVELKMNRDPEPKELCGFIA